MRPGRSQPGMKIEIVNMFMHLSMLTPREGGSGKGWGFDIFTKKMSNVTPSGENSWAKFPTPGMKLYS